MPFLSAEEIHTRARELHRLLDPCQLCPRECGSHRLSGQKGFCQVGNLPVVSSALPHFGEEPPISGQNGSGTVFLTSCNAACLYCQNYQISHLRQGREIPVWQLAQNFLQLQKRGCHNINWVTPEPHLPFLVEALGLAVANGLTIPVVYNSNGYCRVEILKLLEGILDIYLPDMKYSQDIWAEEYSLLPNYTHFNIAAVTEMYRQVGILQLDQNGVATRGLLVRHLVLPESRAGSRKVFEVLAAIDINIPVSIMAQYHPCYRAVGHPVLGRRISRQEYLKALEEFELAGLTTAFTQDLVELEQGDLFFPDFGADEDQIFKGQQKREK
jgi:putative pyruvate formate lyase activating enzyme